MILQIHDSLLISDVQEKFTHCFQHLKIEFYNKPHFPNQGSVDSDMISPDKSIGEIRFNYNECSMDIKSWFTVARIETDFRKLFGLNVQIFRNENGAWIQTTKTDKYSLMHQNEMARQGIHFLPKGNEQKEKHGFL